MPRNKPLVRAVFDCMIFVQSAARGKNPASACFALVEEGVVELYLSPRLLAEIEDVLTRDKLRARFPTLTDEGVAVFLADIKSRAVTLRHTPPVFAYARDPKDEPYINLAIAAEADYIVTRDKDLLNLMTSYTDQAKEFRQRFRPLRVVDPVAFLREIEKASGEND